MAVPHYFLEVQIEKTNQCIAVFGNAFFFDFTNLCRRF